MDKPKASVLSITGPDSWKKFVFQDADVLVSGELPYNFYELARTGSVHPSPDRHRSTATAIRVDDMVTVVSRSYLTVDVLVATFLVRPATMKKIKKIYNDSIDDK